jgi:hypothetical protein
MHCTHCAKTVTTSKILFLLTVCIDSAMAESREGVREIDFNLINLLESGTGWRPVLGLYTCSTIGYNWAKTETPAYYLRSIATC